MVEQAGNYLKNDEAIQKITDMIAQMQGEKLQATRWLIKNFPLLMRICDAMKFTPEQRAAVQHEAEESGDVFLWAIVLLEERLHIPETK